MATDWTDRIRLRNLRFLLSLAQTRNLSHSATVLNTTQPALSKWLRDLEADIGWDDVLHYRWIVWPRQTPVRNALEAALANAGRTLPSNYIESNSVIANVTLLNHSDIIGTASYRTTLMLNRMKLLRIVPVDLKGFGSVSMYWRRDEIFPRSIECALECMREAAREYDDTYNDIFD